MHVLDELNHYDTRIVFAGALYLLIVGSYGQVCVDTNLIIGSLTDGLSRDRCHVDNGSRGVRTLGLVTFERDIET